MANEIKQYFSRFRATGRVLKVKVYASGWKRLIQNYTPAVCELYCEHKLAMRILTRTERLVRERERGGGGGRGGGEREREEERERERERERGGGGRRRELQ